MREIKFRYWDIDGMMSRPFTLQETTGKENWKKLIPMQFTGLKDKNEKDIYEGDIVEFEVLYKTFPEHTLFRSVVEFDKGRFRWNNPRWKGDRFYEIWGPVEIIGNIYENPDLLEEKKE